MEGTILKINIRKFVTTTLVAASITSASLVGFGSSASAEGNQTSIAIESSTNTKSELPRYDHESETARSTVTYSNGYWGISRITGTYFKRGLELGFFDSGILAVNMDRTFELPSESYNVNINVYLNGSSFPTERFYIDSLLTDTRNENSRYVNDSYTVHSSGTVFNPSAWLTKDQISRI